MLSALSDRIKVVTAVCWMATVKEQMGFKYGHTEAGVNKAFNIMHAVWDSQGAGDKIETELWDMPHSCGLQSQQRVLEFFNKHL